MNIDKCYINLFKSESYFRFNNFFWHQMLNLHICLLQDDISIILRYLYQIRHRPLACCDEIACRFYEIFWGQVTKTVNAFKQSAIYCLILARMNKGYGDIKHVL